ncbi:hypothetical protein ACL0VS_17770 [Chryseobacterium sp. PMSZPI]|uniref:hypothetical protein n=1 Tax=Chryseobacterium sp. PMSZPI TaxID=1033900 RepID=UPI0039A0CB52
MGLKGLELKGTAKIGDKGGLNLEGGLTAVNLEFEKVQNIFKLETPNFSKFTFANAEGKAQFIKLFEATGSAWAVQNDKGKWTFLDGKYELNTKADVFSKSDVAAEFDLGFKVTVGIDLKKLFNIGQETKK